MNSETKTSLRKHIECFLERNQHATNNQVLDFLSTGPHKDILSTVNMKTIRSFIRYNTEKFQHMGKCNGHMGGNGRPQTSVKIKLKVKKMAMNKKGASLRKISAQTGLSFKTVGNLLHKMKLKPYHKYKTQKLSPTHKEARVKSAKKLLEMYGRDVRPGRRWARIVNTDFSAKIKLTPTRNSKNDIIWSTSRSNAGDLLVSSEEKFSLGEMIWGGISYRGLIPKESPIFVSELCALYSQKQTTVNATMYADMIREKVGPEVLAVYPEGDAVFQDDGATIHRAASSLAAVAETFKFRLSPDDQANKMADVWPIENVWSIIKSRLDQKPCNSLQQLKGEIKKVWRELNADKNLCRRLVKSIPRRLEAVIQKSGEQIEKADYKM